MPRQIHRIIVVGGGIAGLLLATKLGNTLGRSSRALITLVDKSVSHIWKPMLHTIAAGTRSVQQQQVLYLAHAHDHSFDHQPGEMIGLDRNAQTVQLAQLETPSGDVVIGPRSLYYDVLILALGSRANDFDTPGVAEHCHFIDSQPEAKAFNEALRIRVFQSASTNSQLHVSIVGAGATGVELAAELSRVLDLAGNYGDARVRSRLSLTINESAPRVLAAFPSKVSDSSEAQLRGLGFNVLPETRVTAAEPDGLRLANGSKQPADLMVWAAGVKAPECLGKLEGIASNRSNQIAVRPTLQALEDDKIFALGDCSTLTLEGNAKPLPPTAQVATQQAQFLAKHLPSWLAGGSLPQFSFHDFGSLVSLSDYNAFGTLGKFGFFRGGFIKGRFAQLSHALLYRQHQQALHGLGKASLLWTAERINGLVQPSIRLA